jgi:general secretion pathway protein F
MAAFSYQALDPNGRNTKGIIEANNAADARKALRARQLMPVSIDQTSSKASTSQSSFPWRKRISNKALTLLTRQLATLIGSRISIEEALKTVADQTRQAQVSSMLLNLRASVLDGRSFAQALDDYPQVFGEYYRASVAAGEASSQLGQVMDHLSDFVENRAKNRQTVQLALLYPAILALVSLAVIVALLTFVVPDIVRVFTARGADLPWLTKSLIRLSGFITTWGPLALLGAVGLIIGAGLLLRQPAFRLHWHQLLARSVVTRAFTMKANTAQFAGTLATLVVSQVPLMDALTAAAKTVPNLHIRDKITSATTRVREGVPLSQALEATQVFPPILVAMVASGEAGGVLDRTLTRAAADQSRELKALVSTLVALVEPAVLLLMGGIVMLLVLAILLPIVNLNSLVG